MSSKFKIRRDTLSLSLFVNRLLFSQYDSFRLCFRFINARRRIVQPMIDQSNRAGMSNPVQPIDIYTHLHSYSATHHSTYNGTCHSTYNATPFMLPMSNQEGIYYPYDDHIIYHSTLRYDRNNMDR